MRLLDVHRIDAFDGGEDHLLPGRWLARAAWLGPSYAAFGPTRDAAVESLRRIMAEREPDAPWFRSVPVVARDASGRPLPTPPTPCDGGCDDGDQG